MEPKTYYFSMKKNAHLVLTGIAAYERINGHDQKSFDAFELMSYLTWKTGQSGVVKVTGEELGVLRGFMEYRESFAGKEVRR